MEERDPGLKLPPRLARNSKKRNCLSRAENLPMENTAFLKPHARSRLRPETRWNNVALPKHYAKHCNSLSRVVTRNTREATIQVYSQEASGYQRHQLR